MVKEIKKVVREYKEEDLIKEELIRIGLNEEGKACFVLSNSNGLLSDEFTIEEAHELRRLIRLRTDPIKLAREKIQVKSGLNLINSILAKFDETCNKLIGKIESD